MSTVIQETTKNMFFGVERGQYHDVAQQAVRRARAEFGWRVKKKHTLTRDTLFGTREKVVSNIKRLEDPEWKGANVTTTISHRGRVVGRAESSAKRPREAGYTLGVRRSAPVTARPKITDVQAEPQESSSIQSFFAAQSEPSSMVDEFEDKSLSRMLGSILGAEPAPYVEAPQVFRQLIAASIRAANETHAPGAARFTSVDTPVGSASTFAEIFDDPEDTSDLFAQLRSFMPPFFNDKAANDSASIAGASKRGAAGWGQEVVTYGHEGKGTRKDVLLGRLLADEVVREAVMAALADNADRNESQQDYGLALAA